MLQYATLPQVPTSFRPSPRVRSARARRGRLPDLPLPSSVAWRHCVRETLKTGIENEAENLLKTKGRKFELRGGEADNIVKTGRL